MRSKCAHQYLEQEELADHQTRRSKFLPMLCSSSSTSTKQVMIKLSHQQHRRCSSTCSTTSSTVSDEPSSPRVGCMGQVKRNNKVVGFPTSKSFVSPFNNTTTNSINTTAIKNDQMISNNYTGNSIVKYYKLKRFFSSKSLTASPTTTTTTTIAAATAITRNGTHKGKVKKCVVPHSHKGARTNTTVRTNHHHHGIKSRSILDENYGGSVTARHDKTDENIKGCLVNLVELDPPLPVVKQLQGNNNGESVSLWKRRSGGAPLKSLHVQASPQNCNLVLHATTV